MLTAKSESDSASARFAAKRFFAIRMRPWRRLSFHARPILSRRLSGRRRSVSRPHIGDIISVRGSRREMRGVRDVHPRVELRTDRVSMGNCQLDCRSWRCPIRAAGDALSSQEFFGPRRNTRCGQHIICTIRNAGADNISWVFPVNWEDNPKESWNKLEDYDPGCEFTDWIGISVYGSQSPDSESKDWVDFALAMNGTAKTEGIYSRGLPT